MAEIKGKFITRSCSLLQTKPSVKENVLNVVKKMTGKDFHELEPEGWYNTDIMKEIFESIKKNTTKIIYKSALLLIGKSVYPAIKKSVGLPDDIKTPLDLIKFESKGFIRNHRGPGVIPRKILGEKDGEVIIEAPSPGYDCLLTEGVFLGILEMFEVSDIYVHQRKCIKNGDDTCEYHIKWK